MTDKSIISGTWTLIGTARDGSAIEIPVHVPGYVHTALEAAGLLPSMFYRDNAKEYQWIEEKTWEFRCTFDAPDRVCSTAVLEAAAVDTFADYYLNGMHLGSSRSMFTASRFPVGGILRGTGNVLRIVIHPWREMVGDKPEGRSAFTKERIHIRRMQCTFFWDWVERFVTAGIGAPLRLVSLPESRIESVYCTTKSLVCGYASLGLRLQLLRARTMGCRFAVSITSPDGAIVWKKSGHVFLDTLTMQADIPEPALWWPSGYGDQPLYTLRVELFDKDGACIDEQSHEIGIRTVQLLYPHDADGSAEAARTQQLRAFVNAKANDAPGEGMILVVNGVKINVKGANWVPPTPFPGENDAWLYERLIRLAREGNCNFLRVWGGGIYETDEFYRLCNRYGIMVSQDFMFACGRYPYTDADFREAVRCEAQAAILRLRNHPSLVYWSGDNENCDHFDWDDPQTLPLTLLEAVLIPAMEALDPSREFRLGSPWGGRPNSDLTVGDNHVSWWWRGAEKLAPSDFDQIGRLATESPFAGYPLPSTLEKFLSPEDIADPDSAIVEYHIKNNPYFPPDWPTVHGRLKRNADILVGSAEDADARIYRLAYIQYEWARLTVEGARRAKWYNAGVLFWMYNDCWPALGYAAVDYYGKPKAGWYGGRRAFAPLAASVRCEDGMLEFFVLNDSRTTAPLTWCIRLADTVAGTVTELVSGSCVSEANENCVITGMPLDETGIGALAEAGRAMVFFDLFRDGVQIDRARWYPGWLREVTLAPAALTVRMDEAAHTAVIACEHGIAIGAALDGDCIFADNFVDLLPGEAVRIAYEPLCDKPAITPWALNGVFRCMTENG